MAVAAIIGVAAFILLAMGRTPWCLCGHISLWSGDIWSSENSQQIADPYSFTHITHGVLFFWFLRTVAKKQPIGFQLVVAVLIESAWELFENSPLVIERYRAATISLDYYGDSVLNSVCDILACVLGFVAASRLPGRAAVAYLAVSELALVVLIRDSLFLNIVMLAYPIEAVKNWQMGK
ncbi:MAG: DUF2585 family protein [Chloroflexi bacterium]|nr:DUF2585 family protein [Chloroflexota bacterium]